MKKAAPKKIATKKPPSYVARFRRRQQHSGMKRLDVSVKAKDASLVKSVAATLRADGPEAEQLRQKLQTELSPPKVKTGADFMRLFKNLTPFGPDISFERDNIPRPLVTFD